MIVNGKEYKLFEELSQFEQDKIIFIKNWNSPFMSDRWREDCKKNHLIPFYGCDEPNLIFGKCDDWTTDYSSLSSL